MARTRVRRTTQIYLDADLALKEQALQKARPSMALDGLLTFLKNLYSMPIMPRSKREWPRPQASRAESIRHNSSSRGERCPQPKKTQTISNFANGQVHGGQVHGGNSRIAGIGYKFSRKGRFIGNNRFKPPEPQSPCMTIALTFWSGSSQVTLIMRDEPARQLALQVGPEFL